jgi:putative transposase
MNYRRVYADGYSYFLTMVTYQRKPLLVEHIDLLRYAFRLSKQKYDYHIDAIVVLPDHLHMIITPKIATDYSKIIMAIKRSFVYALDNKTKADAKLTLTASKYKRSHAGIWQERFYEHTIRNEKDWLEKISYIRDNPIKHGLVENPNDWKHSSFA